MKIRWLKILDRAIVPKTKLLTMTRRIPLYTRRYRFSLFPTNYYWFILKNDFTVAICRMVFFAKANWPALMYILIVNITMNKSCWGSWRDHTFLSPWSQSYYYLGMGLIFFYFNLCQIIVWVYACALKMFMHTLILWPRFFAERLI